MKEERQNVTSYTQEEIEAMTGNGPAQRVKNSALYILSRAAGWVYVGALMFMVSAGVAIWDKTLPLTTGLFISAACFAIGVVFFTIRRYCDNSIK